MAWTQYLLAAIGLLIGLVILLVLIGMRVPAAHVARRRLRTGQPPEVLWAQITDFAAMPEWRDELRRVEQLEHRDGCAVWREHGSSSGPLTYRVETLEPPRLMVTRVEDDRLPFAGTWTYQIDAGEAGASLTITESGVVASPLFRAIGRLFFDPHVAIERYLRGLASALGEDAAPEPVE